MGILRGSREDDVQTIAWVVNTSLQAWQAYSEQTRQGSAYRAELNSSVLEPLSDYGEKILSAHFPSPAFLDRVATLVVLGNCFNFIKLWSRGKPVGNIHERREFFARVSCAFVCASLCCFGPSPEERRQGYYVFAGFGGNKQLSRFLAFLQLLEPAELISCSSPKKQEEERALRTFARDILSTANFLEPGIRFVEGGGDQKILEVRFE